MCLPMHVHKPEASGNGRKDCPITIKLYSTMCCFELETRIPANDFQTQHVGVALKPSKLEHNQAGLRGGEHSVRCGSTRRLPRRGIERVTIGTQAPDPAAELPKPKSSTHIRTVLCSGCALRSQHHAQAQWNPASAHTTHCTVDARHTSRCSKHTH